MTIYNHGTFISLPWVYTMKRIPFLYMVHKTMLHKKVILPQEKHIFKISKDFQLRLEAIEVALFLLEDVWDHDDGLILPVNILDAATAFIFLLFDSSSNRCRSDDKDFCDPWKIEEAFIKARLFFLFFSKLVENFTLAAMVASSLEEDSNRIPRPNLLETASSSATLFFWFCRSWKLKRKKTGAKNKKQEKEKRKKKEKQREASNSEWLVSNTYPKSSTESLVKGIIFCMPGIRNTLKANYHRFSFFLLLQIFFLMFKPIEWIHELASFWGEKT